MGTNTNSDVQGLVHFEILLKTNTDKNFYVTDQFSAQNMGIRNMVRISNIALEV